MDRLPGLDPPPLNPGSNQTILVCGASMTSEVNRRTVERYSCIDDDLSSVCGETQWTMSFARGDWRVQTVTHTILTSTPTDFHLHARLDAMRVPSGCIRPTGSG